MSGKKNFLLWLVVSVLFCVVLSWKLFLSREVFLTFKQKSDYPVDYKMYFLSKADALFNDDEVLSFSVNEGVQDVKIAIPVVKKSVWRVKLVVEKTRAETIDISDLKISGKNVATVDKFNSFEFFGFKDRKILGNDIILNLNKGDSSAPYFSLLSRVDSRVHIDYYTLCVLIIVYTLILYPFLVYLAGYKKHHGFSRIDIVFLAVFFFSLWLPMMVISDAEKSVSENRMLEKKPVFSFKNLSGYGQKFNAWFSDRFWGKAELQGLYHDLNGAFSSWGNDLVLKGENDWLFWKGENSLENFQNTAYLTEEELKSLAAYLSSFDEWARKNGKQFYYIITPDKNRVYGENISIISKLKPDSENRTLKLIEYLNANTKVNAHYLGNALVKNKDKGILYWKHDTHWNRLGAYVGYNDIMDFIRKTNKLVNSISYTKLSYKKDDPNDLENFLPSVKRDTLDYVVPEVDEDKYSCKKNSVGVSCVNKDRSKPNLVMFRDSFTENLLPYMASSFGKSLFIWRYSVTPEDLKYIKDNADIIILENGERMIPRLLPFTFPKE